MRTFSIIIFILLIGLGCSTRQKLYTYQICVKKPADKSKIIKNKIVHYSDTVITHLLGRIVSKKTSEPIAFANVVLIDSANDEKYGDATDTSGFFSIEAPPDNYNLQVNHIKYNTLNHYLNLKKGEIREIVIALGKGSAFVIKEIKSDKQLNKKELNRKAKELKN
jgi:hypothetical protein